METPTPQPENQRELFTAADIAPWLDVKVKAVKKALKSVGVSGYLKVRGQSAKAWKLATLPSEFVSRLQTVATENHFRSVEAMLRSPCDYWQPPIPYAEVAENHRQIAERRRDAFAPHLARQHLDTTGALLEGILASYKTIFGHEPQLDFLKYIADRATKRAGSLQNFQRPEIYLDDEAFKRPCPGLESLKLQGLHRPLDEVIKKHEDRSDLFDAVFHHFEMLQSGRTDKRELWEIKRSLVDYIYQALPTISTSAKTFRRVFEVNLAVWKANGRCRDALLDKRKTESGLKPYHCEACFKLVHDQAAHYRGRDGMMGNPTLAYRELRTHGRLCQKCLDQHDYNIRKDKSYVPKVFRDNCTLNLLEKAMQRGSWYANRLGPSSQRRMNINPGDYFVSDDETPNHWTWDEVDGEIITGRVQNLVMSDVACGYVFENSIYMGPPTGRAIKGLIHEVCVNGIGLPRHGFYFERGCYAARVVSGIKGERDAFSFRFLEAGMRRQLRLMFGEPQDGDEELALRQAALGFEVVQARTPNAKPVECDFHIWQKKMSHLPGFGGFRERDEMPDRLAEFLRRVKAGKEHPGNELLRISELVKNYKLVIEEYNHEPQNGKRNPGISPFENWSRHVGTHPLDKLPREMEYLLSTHKKKVKVGPRGIVIQLSRYESAHYFNERLGGLIGQELIGHYSVDFPRLLFLQDPKRKFEFYVERDLTDFKDLRGDQTAKSHANTKNFIAAATQRFTGISHPLINIIVRDGEYSDKDLAFGRFHKETVAKIEAADQDHKRAVNRIKARAADRGELVPATIKNPARFSEADDLEARLRAEEAADSQAQPEK